MEKIKYVCIKSYSNDFTVGKIYEAYPKGASHIVDNSGFEYDGLSLDIMKSCYEFVPLKDVDFMIKCTRSDDERFNIGEYYFIDGDRHIIGDTLISVNHDRNESCQEWYENCSWSNYAFELIKDYTVYKGYAVDEENEVAIVFAQFEGMDSINVFENKEGSLFTKGTKIRVVCGCRKLDACVVSSIRIKKKYVKDLVRAVCRDNPGEAMPIVGVYKQVTREELVEL